ncbi:hypothetical protein K8T06_10525, partial [bacterium]|nr:hypothetical protein [bacterium]
MRNRYRRYRPVRCQRKWARYGRAITDFILTVLITSVEHLGSLLWRSGLSIFRMASRLKKNTLRGIHHGNTAGKDS